MLPPFANTLIDDYVGDLRTCILEYDTNSILYQCIRICNFDIDEEVRSRRNTLVRLICIRWRLWADQQRWRRDHPRALHPPIPRGMRLQLCRDQLRDMRECKRYFNQHISYLSRDFVKFSDAYILEDYDLWKARKMLSSEQMRKLVQAIFVFGDDQSVNPYKQFNSQHIPGALWASTLRI